MDMANADNLAKSENLTITSEHPIINVYNKTLSKNRLMETVKPELCVSYLPHENSQDIVITTEPADDSLSEGKPIKTEKSDRPENWTRHYPTEQSCLTKKDEETNLMENHGNPISDLKEMIETVPSRVADGDIPIAYVCDKQLSMPSNLSKHKLSYTAEKPFLCNICDKRFARSSKLIEHSRSHSGEKPFACKFCDRRYARPSDLTVHKRSHTGEKPFVCKFCDKRFPRSSYHIVHTRSHTGEKRYVCNVCDKRFSRSYGLTQHKRSHTGEKPFVCKFCDKRFSRSSYHIVHTRSHTGENPFVCNVCEKRFSSYLLTQHKRIYTGEKCLQPPS